MSDAFRMPGNSQYATVYVNPYGYTHPTVTVTKLSDCVAYTPVGQPTTEHTWFPGWGNAQCDIQLYMNDM